MALFRFQCLRSSIARFSTMEKPPEISKLRKIPMMTRSHPNLLLHKYLEKNEKMNQEKWTNVREEMLSTRTLSITNVNIDAIILDTCCGMNHPETALNYCEYLKSQGYKFNLAAIARYFKLLTSKDTPISEKDKEDIIQLYETIRKEYPLLDTMTADACIDALSKTKRWKESLELLKMIKSQGVKPRPDVFWMISCAAFNNNEPDIAWEYISQTNAIGPLNRTAYRAFLEYSMKVSSSAQEFEGHVEKLFETLGQNDTYPWLDVLEEIGEALRKYGWSGQQTTIRSNGICSRCGHALPQLDVDKEDFEILSSSFQDRAIIGKDVYDKTDPEELKRFQKFMEMAKPYDVVVDGLNVDYGLSKTHLKPYRGEKLAKVVALLKDQGKKVVVLGRKHMLGWNPQYIKYIQNNAKFFVANNTSEDDPFLIYAALSGGLKTYLVSKDLMRQHKFILSDPALQKTFKLWLLTRQIHPLVKGVFKNTTIFLIYPPNYLPIAQKDDNGWHIPSIPNHVSRQSGAYDLSQPWYCLRKNEVIKTTPVQNRLHCSAAHK